ncbi:MAG TPA: hypothetical protein VMK83_00630 [Gaiellaceae bacterium]|nr:hypothetical protein [Gaiellaceae bacterium]
MHERTGDLVGFRAMGRHGELGVVESDGDGPCLTSLVVRGGVSSGLVYFVPRRYVGAVRPDRRTVTLDVDLHDFVASLRADGIVELKLPS